MAVVLVTDTQHDWLDEIEDVETIDPKEYLTNESWIGRRNVKLYNLAGSYAYQSIGYYVSLLAEARGHRPFPSVTTIQDLNNRNAVRLVPVDLEELIDKSLSSLQGDTFELSVYFGGNLATKYAKLSRELTALFQSPLLRFEFSKRKKWRLRRATAIGLEDIPKSHRAFMIEQAQKHFARGTTGKTKRSAFRYDMAILHNPAEGELAPSDEKALQKMVRAAAALGINAELLTVDDAGRLLEFDALFIRETTAVNHYTYRLARKAEREGMVVIDDPLSILRCTNKVYLAELLTKNKLAIPKTIVAHRANAHTIAAELGFPVVLKRPDSAFSKGVVKVETDAELAAQLDVFFADSELVVAQGYMQTDFDWRIGIMDGRPLFACKYHMAKGHWQIINSNDAGGSDHFGDFETIPVELAPRKCVALAQKSADLIGDGLYGVDIKESEGQFYVIEVNDNPNVDSGVEDKILRDDLYRRIMESFLRRIERGKAPEVSS